MKKWIIYSLYQGKQVGSSRGFESRDEAERVAQSLSTMQEHWYTEIGVYQLVSKAKYSPKGELTKLDDDEPGETA